MANRTYLFYKSNKNDWGEFEYSSDIPSLWQELYTIEILEKQEDIIISAFGTEEDNNNSTLKIPIHIAIENLTNQIKTSQSDTEDKRQLRLDFLNFLEIEVAKKTNIEIAFEEISWFYETPKDFFQALKNFHLKFPLNDQPEKVSFSSIGINDSFESYSIVYKRLNDEDKIINARNRKLSEEQAEKVKIKDAKSKNIKFIFMTILAVILTFLAPFGVFIKEDIKNGILIFCFAIILWIYIYLKHLKK